MKRRVEARPTGHNRFFVFKFDVQMCSYPSWSCARIHNVHKLCPPPFYCDTFVCIHNFFNVVEQRVPIIQFLLGPNESPLHELAARCTKLACELLLQMHFGKPVVVVCFRETSHCVFHVLAQFELKAFHPVNLWIVAGEGLCPSWASQSHQRSSFPTSGIAREPSKATLTNCL